MLIINVISVILFSVLNISEVRGETTFVINSNDDTNEVINGKRDEQRLDSDISHPLEINTDDMEHHNIHIRSAHSLDLLKHPSILIGKLKKHLGFGHKPSGCKDKFHHGYGDLPPRDFKHDGHNFGESQRGNDFHSHGFNEFHNHDGHWNNFPHQEHFPGHTLDHSSTKEKPGFHNKKPGQLPFEGVLTDNDGKVSKNDISSTTPKIDIRFGDK